MANPFEPNFEDKIALVTGSGRGIGKAIALDLAQRGAHIVVNFFRNREPAEATASEIRALGREATVIKANVGEIDQLEKLYESVDAAFGGLDYLIHNAASGFNRPVLQQKPRGWDWTLNINARALLFGGQLAAERMMKRGGGAIVAISSMGSIRVMPDYAAVGASKAALESLVRYLGVELAPHNIRVNAISPGVVLTDALKHFDSFREGGDSFVETILSRTPAGQLCTPEDVAEFVAYLCTPAAKMICGQTIVMDGGHSLLIN